MKSFLKSPFATFKSISLTNPTYVCQRTSSCPEQGDYFCRDYWYIRLVQGGANLDDYGSPNTNLMSMTKHSRTRGWRTTDWYRSVGLAALLTYRGAHTLEHTSKQHRTERGAAASAFKPQPPFTRRASLVARRSAPLLFTSSTPWRSSFRGENAVSSFSSLSFFLLLPLSLSPFPLPLSVLMEQLSAYLYQENF